MGSLDKMLFLGDKFPTGSLDGPQSDRKERRLDHSKKNAKSRSPPLFSRR